MATLGKAALCAGCGCLCPNTWDPGDSYTVEGDKVYCLRCADRAIELGQDPDSPEERWLRGEITTDELLASPAAACPHGWEHSAG
jgi:hypothetical protein